MVVLQVPRRDSDSSDQSHPRPTLSGRAPKRKCQSYPMTDESERRSVFQRGMSPKLGAMRVTGWRSAGSAGQPEPDPPDQGGPLADAAHGGPSRAARAIRSAAPGAGSPHRVRKGVGRPPPGRQQGALKGEQRHYWPKKQRRAKRSSPDASPLECRGDFVHSPPRSTSAARSSFRIVLRPETVRLY